MDSLEKISSKMQPKYVIWEYCFVLMSLYSMFSRFDFLILCLRPNKINFILSSPKWILNLQTSHKAYWNFYLVPFQCRWYLYVEILSKFHQHISIVHSQQLVVYHLYIKEKEWSLNESLRFPGSDKVLLIGGCCFFRQSYELHFL